MFFSNQLLILKYSVPEPTKTKNTSELFRFDSITFWGVLEHVVNPYEQVLKAFSLLKKGGVIIFEVPSADSLLMQYVIKHNLVLYRFIESARHLTFFSKKSLKYLCEKVGAKIDFIESNGLDIQTILLDDLNPALNKKVMNMQQLIDMNLLSDHYRIFLRKI